MSTATAHAEPVRWFLDDVRFSDGTSATGSFIFDADASEGGRYLDIDIITTAGPNAAGARYRDPNPDSPGNSQVIVAVPDDSVDDFVGTTQLLMEFAGTLTNAGGRVEIAINSSSREGECLPTDNPFFCWIFSGQRQVTTGAVTSEPQEDPSPRCDFNSREASYKCFELVTESAPISWEQAKLRAAGREFLGVHGRLATPSTTRQSQFLERSFSPVPGVLLGGQCSGSDGRCDFLWDFEWISGEDQRYGWCAGEPSGDANGVIQVLFDASLCWNDIDGTQEIFTTYFVEYDVADVIPRCFFSGPNATGNCYEIILEPEPLSWQEARRRAETLEFLGVPGRLATITTHEEQQFIARNLHPIRARNGTTQLEFQFGTSVGTAAAGTATFGPLLTDDREPQPIRRLKGRLAIAVDDVDDPQDACSDLTTESAAAVAGKIALIDRGNCAFVEKVFNAQQSGAIGVIVVNTSGEDVFSMGGDTTTAPGNLIEIPSVLVANSIGEQIRGLPLEQWEFVFKSAVTSEARPFIGAECTGESCTSPTDFSWITGEPVAYTNWCSFDGGGGEPTGDPGGVLELFDSRYCWNDTISDAGFSRAYVVEYEIPADEPLCFRKGDGATGNCYQVVSTPGATWSIARELAAERTFDGRSGRLATLNSAEEAAFLGAAISPLRGSGPGPSLTFVEIDAALPIGRALRATPADFGNPIDPDNPVSGPPVRVNDDVGTTGDACELLTNIDDVNGRIALIDRGGCTFITKVLNAQEAGAIGAIIINNAPGDPIVLGGNSSTEPGSLITIPSVMISQEDGQWLEANLGAGFESVALGALPDSTLYPFLGGVCEGGTCDEPDDYAWITGETDKFSPWCPGEPNGDPLGVLQIFNDLFCINDEVEVSDVGSYVIEYPSDFLFSSGFERRDDPSPF